jgi:hypothetical protein
MADIKRYLDKAGLEKLIAQIKTADSNLNTKITTNANAITTLDNSLVSVAKTGKAADVSIADSSNNFTTTTVEDVLAELAGKISDTGTAGKVTINSSSGSDSTTLKSYTFSQGNTEIGTINIPKDLVATKGELITDPDGKTTGTAGTYIKMTIANGSPFYINVTNLIEYNSVKSTAEITLTDSNHVISGTLNTGSIAKAKLDSGVQASLTKADVSASGTDLTAEIERAKAAEAKIATVNSEDQLTGGLLHGEVERATNAESALDAKISAINSTISSLDATVTSTVESGAEFAVLSGITETDGKIAHNSSVSFKAIEDTEITALFS